MVCEIDVKVIWLEKELPTAHTKLNLQRNWHIAGMKLRAREAVLIETQSLASLDNVVLACSVFGVLSDFLYRAGTGHFATLRLCGNIQVSLPDTPSP